MSERKAVVWFGDDAQPNTFFFRSPFRSWKFVVNTALLVAVCVGCAMVMWKLRSLTILPAILMFAVSSVIYPYWGALIRHGRINELYRAGRITEQPSGSPLNELLEVADNSLNEGLRNALFLFGMVLVCLLLWKLPVLK